MQRALEQAGFGLTGGSTRIVARAILATLFAVLAGLELAPIVAVMATDALWFMSTTDLVGIHGPEEFTAALWPPLKPLLRESYYYHYFGFLFYTALRPAHWLTTLWLGSPEVTIAYTQIYGTIIKSAFSTATITSHCWSRMRTFIGFTIRGFLMAFRSSSSRSPC
jgi:hypothetical protein